MSSLLMNADDSCLVVVDVQEKLAPVMDDPRRVIEGSKRLLIAAQTLGIDLLITEQYPKGLGPTMIDLRQVVPPEEHPELYVEKTCFSCAFDDGFNAKFNAIGKSQAVVAGIESHVCVMQTCLGLKDAGKDVFVVQDCCSSRQAASVDAAMNRMRAAGIHVVTLEMVIFEWLKHSDRPEFKELQGLIK